MIISVPYSWLKEYVSFSVSPQELALRMSLAGCTIDRIRVEQGETVFDVEITTNRPDAYSVFGFAREVAAVFSKKRPDALSEKEVAKQYARFDRDADSNNKKNKRAPYTLDITIKNSCACRRYCGIILDNIKVSSSPTWMQKRLRIAGMRPINNVVDITNYVMLEFGQPMHAFDAVHVAGCASEKEAKLFRKEIVVRNAKSGEVITTLDGEEKKLSASMLVIADAQGPLAIAGIKGSTRAGIHDGTNTIVLESANFEPISIRATSRALDLRTDSSSRYEKGLSPEYCSRALIRAVELLQKYAYARIVSGAVDAYPKKERKSAILFAPSEITRMLGISIPKSAVKQILISLGFRVTAKGGLLVVEPPFWRRGDCEAPHDLVEEVARIYGYEKIPARLLGDEIPPLQSESVLLWEKKTKHALCSRGWTEVMSYSCVGESAMEKMGINSSGAVKIYNPLSSECAYLRTNLLGGLLETVAHNEQRASELRVFEISKVYSSVSPQKLPLEHRRLAGVLTSKGHETQMFRAVRGIVEDLSAEWFGKMSNHISFHLLDSSDSFWQKGKTARVLFRGKEVGMCGFPVLERLSAFGIKTSVACFDFAFEDMSRSFEDAPIFTQIPKYPLVVRDIAFVVSKNITYQDIESAIRKYDPLITSTELFDVFEGARIGAEKKSLALHITYSSMQRTLHAEEVDGVHAKVREMLEQTFHAIAR